jgi:uncharacterized protein (TIGR01777 family)
MNEIDVVINLAGDNIGSGFWTNSKKERIIQSRVLAGKALSQAILAAKTKPQVFIQASGVGYYGTSTNQVFDESSPNGDDFLANVAKQWEESSSMLDSTEVRRVIIRSGVVLDKTSGAFPLMAMPFKFFVGGPLGNGKQMVSWIHLVDEVNAIQFIIENRELSGPVNLTSPNALKNSDFGKTIAKVAKKPYWFPTPGFALKLLLGEKSTLVLDGQNAIPKKLLDHGFDFKYSALEKALESL